VPSTKIVPPKGTVDFTGRGRFGGVYTQGRFFELTPSTDDLKDLAKRSNA
jgi:hypothetical protein